MASVTISRKQLHKYELTYDRLETSLKKERSMRQKLEKELTTLRKKMVPVENPVKKRPTKEGLNSNMISMVRRPQIWPRGFNTVKKPGEVQKESVLQTMLTASEKKSATEDMQKMKAEQGVINEYLKAAGSTGASEGQYSEEAEKFEKFKQEIFPKIMQAQKKRAARDPSVSETDERYAEEESSIKEEVENIQRALQARSADVPSIAGIIASVGALVAKGIGGVSSTPRQKKTGWIKGKRGGLFRKTAKGKTYKKE